METFAQRLRHAIKDKGMSQKELAEKTGVSAAAISGYLDGTYMPRKNTLARLAHALDVDEDTLLGSSPFVKPLKDGEARKVQLPLLDIEVR